ncbi:Trehalose recp domain containing protein, partial [Asbolus verrucosus]
IIVFYLFGIVTQLSYLHLAQNFSKFIDEWHNNDDIMNQNYGYPNNLNLRLKLLTLLCIVLYTGEVFFCVSFHFKRNIYGCEHDSRKKILSKNIFPEVYYHNNIHLVFKAISAHQRKVKPGHFVLKSINFNPLLKFKNDEYWRSVRENYDKLSVLCTNLDNHISFLILLSFANNIFFVLIQVHYGLRLKSDAIGGSYFFYSFVHQLARLISVSLHAAWINDESKKPRAILDSLPSTTYNLEIQRLAVQISLDNVVLTGSKLFRIRRGLILNVKLILV